VVMPAGAKDRVPADTSDSPVENVSWQEANEFCRKLTRRTTRSPLAGCTVYRRKQNGSMPVGEVLLRTSFTISAIPFFQASQFQRQLSLRGGEKGPDLERTCKVGSTRRIDRSVRHARQRGRVVCGLVRHGLLSQEPAERPTGACEGFLRVVRGGCWGCNGRSCRSAFRNVPRQGDQIRSHTIGFRVALVPLYPRRDGNDLGTEMALRRNLNR